MSRKEWLTFFGIHSFFVVPFSVQETKALEQKRSIDIFTSPTGVQWIDTKIGSGSSPNYGQVISYHYDAFVKSPFTNEMVKFDSTYDRRSAYLEKHGNGRTIQGLVEGIHSMKVGGKRRIIIPQNLAYVKSGIGPIPPGPFARRKLNAMIEKFGVDAQFVFDVELRTAYDDEADLGYYADESYTLEQIQQASQRARQGLRPEFEVF